MAGATVDRAVTARRIPPRYDPVAQAGALIAARFGPDEPVLAGIKAHTKLRAWLEVIGLVGLDVFFPRYQWGSFYVALTPRLAVLCRTSGRTGLPAAIKATAQRGQRQVDVTVDRRGILIRLWPDGRERPALLHASRRRLDADRFVAVATATAEPGGTVEPGPGGTVEPPGPGT